MNTIVSPRLSGDDRRYSQQLGEWVESGARVTMRKLADDLGISRPMLGRLLREANLEIVDSRLVFREERPKRYQNATTQNVGAQRSQPTTMPLLNQNDTIFDIKKKNKTRAHVGQQPAKGGGSWPLVACLDRPWDWPLSAGHVAGWMRAAFPHWGEHSDDDLVMTIESADFGEFLVGQIRALRHRDPFRQVAAWLALVWHVNHVADEFWIEQIAGLIERVAAVEELPWLVRAVKCYLLKQVDAGREPGMIQAPDMFLLGHGGVQRWRFHTGVPRNLRARLGDARREAFYRQAEHHHDRTRTKRVAGRLATMGEPLKKRQPEARASRGDLLASVRRSAEQNPDRPEIRTAVEQIEAGGECGSVLEGLTAKLWESTAPDHREQINDYARDAAESCQDDELGFDFWVKYRVRQAYGLPRMRIENE